MQQDVHYRTLAEAIPQIVWTANPDGWLDFYNQHWFDYTGLTLEQTQGWGWEPVLHPDDLQRCIDRWTHAVSTGEPYETEYRFKRAADGEYRWHLGRALPVRDADGAIVKWFGTCTDIHDQKEAAEVLRRSRDELEALVVARTTSLIESEARFRSATEHSAIGLALVAPDGRWLDVNPALCQLLGFPAEELLQKTFQELTHPDDMTEELEQMRALLEGERASFTLEQRLVRRDASIAWVLLTWSLVRDVGGTPLYFISQIQDETERRTLEEQLRHSQKMEAVGQLAAGVAHDFNNMLTAIGCSAGLAYEELPADSPIRDDLIDIQDAAGRAAALTRQLLSFSRRQVIQLTALDLNDVVHAMQRMLQRITGGSILFRTHLAPELWAVYADAGQLEQVLLNLVVNARHAMHETGTLSLTTANGTLLTALQHGHGVIEPGDYAVLALEDTGDGMSADTLAKLFEPFFTTKPEGEGTGLGLATVHGIIHQMHGHITVESTLGRGSRFAVYLPRHQFLGAAPTSARNEAGSAPMADGRPRTILVVDDEVSLRDLARRVLTREGFRVLTAAHGVEALRLLERAQDQLGHAGPSIDLVLTDMKMPVMGGRELGEAIASRHPDVRVLYMSAYSADSLRDDWVMSETRGLLQKPFSVTELARAVVQAMPPTVGRVS